MTDWIDYRGGFYLGTPDIGASILPVSDNLFELRIVANGMPMLDSGRMVKSVAEGREKVSEFFGELKLPDSVLSRNFREGLSEEYLAWLEEQGALGMGIYVDELIFTKKNGGKKFCHMATDGGVSELHEFAELIGLERCWFEISNSGIEHYDLDSRFRGLAIEKGATEISCKDFVKKFSHEARGFTRSVENEVVLQNTKEG